MSISKPRDNLQSLHYASYVYAADSVLSNHFPFLYSIPVRLTQGMINKCRVNANVIVY